MLFTKRRSDGRFVGNLPAYYRLLPHIMPSVNDAVIFYKLQADVTDALAFLEARNAGRESVAGVGPKTTLFHVMAAALLRVGAEKPALNRFIAGRRIYSRNKLTISFTMDMGGGRSDGTARVALTPEMTLAQVSDTILGAIREVRGDPGEVKPHEKDALDALVRLPRFVLAIIAKALKIFNHHGMFIRTLEALSPTFCSVYVANLGSFGVDAPFHHIFDFGTASVFVTMGNIHKEWITTRDLKFELRDVCNFAFTIDERVISGGEAAGAVKRFKELMEDPKQLDIPYAP